MHHKLVKIIKIRLILEISQVIWHQLNPQIQSEINPSYTAEDLQLPFWPEKMKVTLVFSVFIVILNYNVLAYKQSLRSSKDTVPHYVRCGKGDNRCGKENRELDGNNRNLMERIAYDINIDENDRCGCPGKVEYPDEDRCGCVKGDTRIRKHKYNEEDRCGCGGGRNAHKSRDRCGCGRSGDHNENVERCACDTKPTLLYIEASESAEDSSVEEESEEVADGSETPQAITELLHEYGKDFLMIGKVLSEVARRSNYIGAANDGYVTFHRGCPPGKVQAMTGACVNLTELLPTSSTMEPTTKSLFHKYGRQTGDSFVTTLL